MTKCEFTNKLVSESLTLGASKAAVINVEDVVFDPAFRNMCASNACGMYGKCWVCPPDVGDIETLIAKARSYDLALVYQVVYPLEDSFDFEGMVLAKKNFKKLSRELRKLIDEKFISNALYLGAGDCSVCDVCSKKDNEPCRFPDLAMASLEAYGVNVSKLAESSGMKYINGADTVTYFGAVLFKETDICQN